MDSAVLDLKTILERAKTIAVVGCSPRPERTSNRIARYLRSAGYQIVPVNPYHDEILGEECYPSLTALPASLTIDIVDVFRRPKFTAGVVQDVIVRRDSVGQTPVVWTQLGVSSQEAQQLALENAIPYIANRCILVEHGRLLG